jgi:hypothetical protein
MKECSYCGRDDDDDALNCRECGTEFEKPNETPAAKEPRQPETSYSEYPPESSGVIQKKRQKLPDEQMGKIFIIIGNVMVILPLFTSQLDMGRRLSAAATGFMALSWGLKQVAAAKKWKQEYGEPTPEEQMEVKKNHSISNLPKLLGWLALCIVALYFLALIIVSVIPHYQGVQLIRPDPYLPKWSPPTNWPPTTNK